MAEFSTQEASTPIPQSWPSAKAPPFYTY